MTISTLTLHPPSRHPGEAGTSNLSVGVLGVTGRRASPEPTMRVPGRGRAGRFAELGVPMNFAISGLILPSATSHCNVHVWPRQSHILAHAVHQMQCALHLRVKGVEQISHSLRIDNMRAALTRSLPSAHHPDSPPFPHPTHLQDQHITLDPRQLLLTDRLATQNRLPNTPSNILSLLLPSAPPSTTHNRTAQPLPRQQHVLVSHLPNSRRKTTIISKRSARD